MRPWLSLRPWILLAALLLWLWAGSVFAPWAESRAPRLWLFDLLFYLRFALLFWAVAEIAHWAWHRQTRASMRRALPLVAIVAVAFAAWAYAHAEASLRWKVSASRHALATATGAGYNDQRRRAGHFLVDTTRLPCRATQPWLWLGRPHGGGSGINRALVWSGDRVPETPLPGALVFSPMADGWWMAYQHADRYRLAVPRRHDATTPCVSGAVVTHRQGMAFINAGR